MICFGNHRVIRLHIDFILYSFLLSILGRNVPTDKGKVCTSGIPSVNSLARFQCVRVYVSYMIYNSINMSDGYSQVNLVSCGSRELDSSFWRPFHYYILSLSLVYTTSSCTTNISVISKRILFMSVNFSNSAPTSSWCPSTISLILRTPFPFLTLSKRYLVQNLYV